MKLNIVLFGLFLGCVLCDKTTYRAGIASRSKNLAQVIKEASKSNADIIVLPAPEINTLNSLQVTTKSDNYDEMIKTISTAARENGIYVVSHLYEKVYCEDIQEVIRSNLVFNRQGAVISTYKKPLNGDAKCNTTAAEIGSFITDFGVTFGVLMEEDLVLQNLQGLTDVKNYVVTGPWASEIPVLSAGHFYPGWSYVTNANLLTSSGVYAGRSGLKTSDGIHVAELRKNGGEEPETPISVSKSRVSCSEDLSHFIIRPVDLAASTQGLRETVCYGGFCCQFYVKTASNISRGSDNFGLAVFDGIRRFGNHQFIGTQSCAVIPCAGVYKRSCNIGSENNTNVVFEEISITGVFERENSVQFPLIVSSGSNKQFKFDKTCKNNTNEVTIKINDVNGLANVGIFGRVFSSDYVAEKIVINDDLTYNIYEYIDGVQEFFDTVWIWLRVLIFVVSIYILEMM